MLEARRGRDARRRAFPGGEGGWRVAAMGTKRFWQLTAIFAARGRVTLHATSLTAVSPSAFSVHVCQPDSPTTPPPRRLKGITCHRMSHLAMTQASVSPVTAPTPPPRTHPSTTTGSKLSRARSCQWGSESHKSCLPGRSPGWQASRAATSPSPVQQLPPSLSSRRRMTSGMSSERVGVGRRGSLRRSVRSCLSLTTPPLSLWQIDLLWERNGHRTKHPS